MLRFLHLNKNWSLLALAVIGLLAIAPQSQAALLGTAPVLPGQTLPTGLVPSGTAAGTLLASLVSAYSFSTTAGITSGTLTSAVYREAGGTLDFYYQVANSASSASAIARETDTNFVGFTTSLGYRTDGSTLAGGFVNGTVAPVLGDVNGIGTVVGFHFDLTDANKIAAGQTSTALVISTNATNYTAGNAAVIDGGTQTVAAFQPAPGVPEPGTMVLLGAGLLALAGIRKFRS